MSQVPTAYELALQRDWSKNRAGKQTARRRFVVDTIDPAAALLADGIPQTNTSHPDLPGLRLDRYNVSVSNDGTCNVDCDYSNDSRFVDLRQPDKDDPAWYHWGWAQRKVMVDIPICVRSLVINDGLNGSISKKVWKIAKKQVAETRVVRPLNVRVRIDNVRDLDVIADQTDKLHLMPDGKLYQFQGATVSQVDDEGFYDISYTWEYDQGTTFFPEPQSRDVQYCTPVIGVGGQPVRPQYTVLVGYQVGNPETDKPIMEWQPLYEYGNRTAGNNNDGLGWQLLPGANRII
jgi:hypothetical protein